MTSKIKDLCKINEVTLKNEHNLSYILYLDTANLNQGTIDFLQRLLVGVDSIPSRAKRIVRENDILFSTVRPNQLHYGFVSKPKKNLICSTGFAVLSPKEDVEPYYLFKYLTQNHIIEYLQGIAETSTSTYPSIKPSDIGELEVNFPSLSVQRSIAKIFSSLDDKIELNNKINKNLEEIAQTLYKRWFVDFEFPNENGEPYKSSGGEMVDSELGMIPKGWEVQGYNNIFEITYGKSKYSSKEKTIIGKYHVYGAGGIVSKTDNYDYELQQVIVGCRGTCGQVSLTKPKSKITHNSLVLNQKTKDPYYHFLLAKNNDLKPFITGSTQPQITINDLNKCCSVQSDKSTIDRFNHFVSPIFQKILMNEKESFIITKIRDELLPKLMSGEIEVPVEE